MPKPYSTRPHSAIQPNQAETRQQLLKKRSALSKQQQHSDSLLASKRLITFPSYQTAKHIALYFPIKRELNPLIITHKALKQHKKLYLPQITKLKERHMAFRAFQSNTQLTPGRFGIPEPNKSRLIHTFQLDLIICPLVAFDAAGHRIGMGGGYYDTYLKNPINRPKLIGFGYSWQQVPYIQSNQWDISLDGIITEKDSFLF